MGALAWWPGPASLTDQMGLVEVSRRPGVNDAFHEAKSDKLSLIGGTIIRTEGLARVCSVAGDDEVDQLDHADDDETPGSGEKRPDGVVEHGEAFGHGDAKHPQERDGVNFPVGWWYKSFLPSCY